MNNAGGSATEHTIRTTATSTGTSHGTRSVITPSLLYLAVSVY